MAGEEKKQPIVIKRIVKKDGHHGGAWKIAFADFAIAMMAFFLLLWILAFTDEIQKAAISEYFQNPSAAMGISPTPPHPTEGSGTSPSIIDFEGAVEPQDPESAQEHRDEARLESLMEVLEEALEKSQALEPFKDQLLLDITPEGLRIQIVDRENRPMFDLGSGQLKDYSRDILEELGGIINRVPNRISITGHTDTRRFPREDYTNWELSTDRANAARRALIAGGMAEDKVARVVGLGSTVLFDKTDPQNPINRRISIIVLNRQAEEAMREQSGVEYSGSRTSPPPTTP